MVSYNVSFTRHSITFLHRIQKINTARCTLERFMLSQVEARKVSIRSQLADGVNEGGNNKDVFTLLVRANELEVKDKLRLTDQELVSTDAILESGEDYD